MQFEITLWQGHLTGELVLPEFIFGSIDLFVEVKVENLC